LSLFEDGFLTVYFCQINVEFGQELAEHMLHQDIHRILPACQLEGIELLA
jgi:Na+/H+ antiporter NhaA